MTDKEYFAHKALSKSQIRNWRADNPLQFWNNSVLNPNKIEDEMTDAMVFGSLTHAMLFEREKVNDMFVVTDGLGKSRETMKWRKAQADEEKKIITTEEKDKAEKMVKAILSYQLYRDILFGVKTEVPYIWNDVEWGLPCKAKIDAIKAVKTNEGEEGIIIIDYKTTGKMDTIIRHIDKGTYQYDIGFYNKMCKVKYGKPLHSFVFLFQSNKENEEYLIKIRKVSGVMLEACDIATDNAVRQIRGHYDRWLAKDPTAWLPKPSVEDWEVSQYFDTEVSEIQN